MDSHTIIRLFPSGISLMVGIFSFPLVSNSQAINERYWKRYRNMADSVVISRLGKDVFEHHVFTEKQVHHDLADLIYLSGDSTMAWADRSTVTSGPIYCFFEYELCLDKRERGPTIRFALDPSGQLVKEEPSNGLPSEQMGRNGFAMSIGEFERTARSFGFQWNRSDAYRSLYWTTDDGPAATEEVGTYELTLGRHVGEGFESGVGYTYLFEIIEGVRFDAFTGQVRAKGIFQVPSGIVCSSARL